jgi:glutathione S-transferase
MLTVHHLENSRSQRILWLLEELQCPYEVKRYARDPRTRLAPAALKEVHPLGKSPVITDDGITVAETGAIIEYILETYGSGRLVPAPGSAERRAYSYWMHAAEGSVMPLLVIRILFEMTTRAPVPWLLRPVTRLVASQVTGNYIDPAMRTSLDLMENALADQPWFAGAEFTAADIMISFPVEAAAARTMPAGAYPGLRAFLARIHAREAYQRALKRGGPYEMMS